jgi:ATP-binding cassette subfamily B protein IrtA
LIYFISTTKIIVKESTMKTKKQSALSRLMDIAGEHKYLVYLSWILAVLSAWIALVPFYDVWRIIKEILEVKPDYANATHITAYGWQAVEFALLAMAVYIVALMCSHKAAFRVQSNMRVSMMEHIMKLPLGYVESQGTGKIRKVVNDSSAATETFIAHNLPDKAVSAATPVGLLVMMMVFDWRLGLISLIPAVIAFILMGTLMMGPKMAEDMKQYQNSLETMSAEAVEYVRGIPVVKTFGQTVFSFKRFKAAIDDYEKWTLDYTKSMMLPMIGFTTASNGIFAALIIAAYTLGGNQITTQFALNLIFYILITSTLTTTLMKVAYAGESQMIVEDALNRMDGIFAVSPLPLSDKKSIPKDSSISIENVTFAYDESKDNAIDGITMHVKAGEHVALVGPSGGGKTTLASLIARFWDVKSGSIRLGGADVKDIDAKELMNQVSYVFQDSKLLKMSILENVRMGRPDAGDDEVMKALQAAQCMDIIEKFPDGVNTVIGSKGIYVSGGEVQRLSIARAFLKNAPVLILDEATAFADPDNERLVQKAFENLAKDKTVIMIAHRLSTVTDADCIYVLKDGRIAESGTHDELTAKNGIYTHMWNEYNKSVNWQVGRNGEKS